jgi:LysR family transcriptional regulator, glycine cleavage system transcriptional activator
MKIPPLNPLRVFEVVARSGSLTQAAGELRVSQSAVSRQIAVLEEYLGVQLLTREHGGVKLTEVGAIYSRRISPALAEISNATCFVTKNYSDNIVRVRAYTTFTLRWLIPRLSRDKVQFPDIDVVIENSTAPLNFGAESCDLAVLLGDGSWPDAHATLLFDDVIEPVCATSLLSQVPDGENLAADLLSRRFLVSKYRKNDWPSWLAHAGQSNRFDLRNQMTFSSSVLAWQAAIDGLGIAIGQQHMVDADVRAGRLVRPFSLPLRTGKGHYIVTPALQRFSPKVESFRDWLLYEAGAAANAHAH